jgi:hypothetical protein
VVAAAGRLLPDVAENESPFGTVVAVSFPERKGKEKKL